MSKPFPSQDKRLEVGLPPRIFFYTIEQISALLSISENALKATIIHFDGRSAGAHKKDTLLAVNIAPLGQTPIWRVSENELIRWCRHKNIRIYERGWAQP